MAVFDTAISDINKFTKDTEDVVSYTEDSSDSSPGLIGDHHLSRKTRSSMKGPRRSSRLSKGRDEDDLSDDSDPHIDMGVVMMHEEEKFLMEEEQNADKKLARKQQMGVALVKSVVMKEEDVKVETLDYNNKYMEPKHLELDETDSKGKDVSNTQKRQKMDEPSQSLTNPGKNTSPTTVPTRSSSRKITKTSKALKAVDDSTDEHRTKRITPKPSAPVPNPILKSPERKQITQTDLKKDPSLTPTRSNGRGRSIRSLKGNLTQELPVLDVKNEDVVPETFILKVDMNKSRKRIFSIDLDPDTFDFDFEVGDHIADTVNSSDSALYRSRGMSFELFNFSVAEPSGDLRADALNGGRPRGDSIIFDPISFADGGIHEEAAFHNVRHNSLSLDENDDLKLLTTSAYDSNSLTVPPSSSIQPSPMLSKNQRGSSSNGSKIKSSNTKNKSQNKSMPAIKSPSSSQSQSSKSKHHMAIVNGSTISSSDNEETLHMPQGSAAAAAAAASISTQILQSTMNGIISHTSCPMDLLNKGGRIGIYLPDARRERISKFHSKRKNRIWRKRIKYDCRKKLADSRPRVKGRFVKSLEPEDE